MKSSHLYVAFLLATLFSIQVLSLKLARNQLPLSINIGEHNYFGRLGFKELLELSMDEQSATQTMANVFRYYIDGRDYFNYVQELYCEANDGQKFITLQKFFEVTDAQGVHRVDAHRVSEYVRGVFGTVHEDHDDTPIDAFTFTQAVDLLFAESVSILTFSYIVQSSRHSRHVTVDLESVQLALVNIFSTYGESLPGPDCDEIKYLFKQSDVDQDGQLNLQEFHVFLSIYLRYYKYGIQNNRYAVTVMKDQVFEYVWNNEDGLGGHTERTNFLELAFARFLQMTVYDRIQNQMSHLFFTKFDSDGSGAIDKQEFTDLLEFFHAPTNEIDVLFISADTDGSGQIDFAEFIVTLTTLLRKLTADFGYNLLTGNGQKATLQNTYAVFKEATSFLRLELVSEETFAETFNSVDEDHNIVLSLEEFTKFISDIIGLLRAKIRIQEEAQISAVASLDVNEVTPGQINAAIEQASEQVSDIVYADTDITTEEDAINQVEDLTGADIEEINEAVAAQLDGATVQEVIAVVENIATEEIIEAVTAAVIEGATSTECPTAEIIENVIEEVLDDGTVDEIIENIEQSSTEEIIDVVAEAIEEEHQPHDDGILGHIEDETGYTGSELAEAVEGQLEGASVQEVVEAAEEIATEEVIDAVTTAVIEEASSSDCVTREVIQETIEEVIEDGTIDDIVHEIETTPSEDLVETVTEVVVEEHPDEIIVPADSIIAEAEAESGYSGEDLNAAAEEEFGVPVQDVVEAAEAIATEEIIDAVTTAIIEGATSDECVTPETIEHTIEEVLDDGIVEDIITTIEETPTAEIIESVAEQVEEQEHHEEDHHDEESHEEEHHEEEHHDEEHHDDGVLGNFESETGYTEEELETVVENELGASAEEVVEAAEQIATEQVIDAVTTAVIEEAASSDCPTAETIEAVIEEVLEDGLVEDVIETIAETPTEDLVETVAEVVEETHEEHEHEDEYHEHIEAETGYTVEEVETALEEQLGGATVEEVAEAAEAIATEEVVQAVTEAVAAEVEATGCTTVEDVQAVIEQVIEDGVVEDIVEELETASPEEVVEAVEAAIEEEQHPEEHHEEEHHEEEHHEQEHHDDAVVAQIEEEYGYSVEEVNEAVEAHVDGASVEEVIEAAEALATEEVIEAVAAAVLEESASGECITSETLQPAIEEALEEGIVDEIVEELAQTPPEEIVEAVAEVVEEEHHEDHEGHTEFIQLSGFKNFLA